MGRQGTLTPTLPINLNLTTVNETRIFEVSYLQAAISTFGHLREMRVVYRYRRHCEIDYGLSKSTSNIKSHVATHHKPEYDVCLSILEPFMEAEKTLVGENDVKP